MKQRTLLVTGGAGFIGANYIHYFLNIAKDNSFDAVINLDKLTYCGNLDNLSDCAQDKRYQFIHGDIGDKELLSTILRENNVSGVINFAAETHVDRSIHSPEPFFETNVMGTLELLEVAMEHWKNLSLEDKGNFKFVHVSTDEVYGSLTPSKPPFTEQTPFAPNSPYAASKAASDHAMRAFFHTYGFPVIVSHCSNNYGPLQFPEKLIPLMILNALDEKALPIYGDGLQVRDWLYVEDHCSALHTLLINGKAGEVYNIGGHTELTNLAVIDAICDCLDELEPRAAGVSYKGLKEHVADRLGHDRRYAINCNKIERELGWKPEHSFVNGLAETIKWYLAHREWCQHIFETKYQRQRLGVIK